MRRLHIDNKGNVLFVNEQYKYFTINENECWDSLDSYLRKTTEDFKMLEVFKFGQGTIVFKNEEDIYVAKYNETKLTG